MNIYEKLNAIQGELNAPKNQYNSFGGYSYRNCEDVLEALKPLLEKNKATLVITDSIEQIGDRFYVVASALLFNTEKPEEKIVVQAYAREQADKKGMDASQITRSNFKLCTQICFKSVFLQ